MDNRLRVKMRIQCNEGILDECVVKTPVMLIRRELELLQDGSLTVSRDRSSGSPW